MGPVISAAARANRLAEQRRVRVLGQLIADVTGMPYANAVGRLVLGPLGMRDSRFPEDGASFGRDASPGIR